MNVAPRLYQRGSRGIWWTDLGDLGGVRLRRSTGTANREQAEQVARSMHAELQRHELAQRARVISQGVTSQQWKEQLDSVDGVNMLDRIWKNGRSRARQRGLLWALSFESLRDIALHSGGRCSVTGLGFRLSGPARDPFKLSIDRVDSLEGYTKVNCRAVLLGVNLAMNAWGEDLFSTIALGFAAKQIELAAQNSHKKFRDAESSRK